MNICGKARDTQGNSSLAPFVLARAIKRGASLTDNVRRTAPEMRVLFRKGQLCTSGAVAWDFDHLGMIEAAPLAAGADPEEAAIEAGAQDLEPGEEEGTTLFYTAPTELDLVSNALGAEALEEVEAFLAALDEHDDVQNVYVGLTD